MYPPIKNSIDDNRAQNFDPNSIPVTSETVVCGDFNAHSSSWDPNRPVNNVGRQLDDWIANSVILLGNDGSPTRINPGTGNWSAPDVTLYNTSWHGLIDWETLENSMGSDHVPICITIRSPSYVN